MLYSPYIISVPKQIVWLHRWPRYGSIWTYATPAMRALALSFSFGLSFLMLRSLNIRHQFNSYTHAHTHTHTVLVPFLLSYAHSSHCFTLTLSNINTTRLYSIRLPSLCAPYKTLCYVTYHYISSFTTIQCSVYSVHCTRYCSIFRHSIYINNSYFYTYTLSLIYQRYLLFSYYHIT